MPTVEPQLSPQERETVRTLFANSLANPVRVVLFVEATGCTYCSYTRQLVEEVAELSEQLSADVYAFAANAELARQYQVDRVPAMVIIGERDRGVRIYGIPAGYEFPPFLEAIILVSRGDHGLAPSTMRVLDALSDPVHLQVFFSTNCPYCADMVRLAHQFALASDHVRADAIDARQFSDLYNRYNPEGVPATVINGSLLVTGVMTESELAQNILLALE